MFDDIEEFHLKFGLEGPSSPVMPDEETLSFRNGFLREELKEIAEAIKERDLPKLADGYVDLCYVAVGSMYLAGCIMPYMVSERSAGGPVEFPDGNFLGLMQDNLDQRLRRIEQASRNRDVVRFGMHHSHLVNIAVMSCIFTGIPFRAVWDEVHSANMKKERAKSAADSTRGSKLDVVKPPGWTAPDVAKVLREYGWPG